MAAQDGVIIRCVCGCMRNGVEWLLGEKETQNRVRLTVEITHILKVLTSAFAREFEWKRSALKRSCNYSAFGVGRVICPGMSGRCGLFGRQMRAPQRECTAGGLYPSHGLCPSCLFLACFNTSANRCCLQEYTHAACRHVTSMLHYLKLIQLRSPTNLFIVAVALSFIKESE